MKATFQVADAEYAYLCPIVHDMLFQEMPGVEGNQAELVDYLTSVICGTRQTRLAGMPNPESLVMIRDVIRHATQGGTAIPILVPAGPKKNSMTDSIDLAELSALRALACLQKKVQEKFEPGLSIRFRLEDLTGWYLEGSEAGQIMNRYCFDFKLLVATLGYSSFMSPLTEGQIIESSKLIGMANEYVPLFESVLQGKKPDTVLAAIGWKSGLGEDQKGFLFGRYAKLYPHLSEAQCQNLAAKYMAIALARGQLGAHGGDPEWQHGGGRIDISFAPPMPGAPMTAPRVYYRTVPVNQTKLHVPFWRAKGFFKIDGENVKTGVTPWPKEPKGFTEGHIHLESEAASITVRADILTADE